MNKNTALDLALEAVEWIAQQRTGGMIQRKATEAITAIKQARSAPVQEPPPECQTEAEKRAYAFGWWKALEANRAAQWQWVGLTDEEIQTTWDSVMEGAVFTRREVYKAIEAKLKEKNNG
jgi:hypothetical protein